MSKLPTDRQVLRCIFEMYESSYPGRTSAESKGENDPYLPIDITEVAKRLDCKPELLFGRLYYYLDARHRYKQDNDAIVSLFQLNLQGKRHCVHFPFLASILAGHEEEHKRNSWSLAVSIVALVLSVGAILAQVLTA
ncbi:MAG: hypothetical protein KKD65_08330 [Gammaproteobacteria bacterium]|nr:hypothetical protein [Gammaproteobacteria bacterium]